MSYYQSAMNSGAIERGTREYDLPETFVIFLCADDPFGYGHPRYDFEVRCKKAEGLVLETGSHWVVLNASDYEREQNVPMRDLLRYVATREVSPGDALIGRIDEKVRVLNRDKELVEMSSMLMTFEEDAIARGKLRGLREGREEGHAEGMAEGIVEGEARLSSLINKLLDSGRVDEIKRVTTDAAYREALFQEFDLT